MKEDFYQGYACAMEEIEFRLKNKISTDVILDYIREEVAAADKKIQEIRLIEGN